MKLLSVNVGLPRELEWRGEKVRSSIFKSPVAGSVRVRVLNLDGDRQSDLSVHGGVDKAVYAYPSEHYAFWQSELGLGALPWAAFGENLTTEGLLEREVAIGDHLRCGAAELVVTQPRMPCFKLGIRFGRPEIVKRFQKSGLTGFYLAVVKEGELAAGDPIELVPSRDERISVADAFRAATDRRADPELVRRIGALPALSESWREDFRARLAGG